MEIDFTTFTNDQLRQAYDALKTKAFDESLGDEERAEAKRNAVAILNLSKTRKPEELQETREIADEVKGFRQRFLAETTGLFGIPTDLAVGAFDRYVSASQPGIDALREKFGKEPIGELPSAGDERYGMPTSENLKRSVQNLGELVGVDMLGDYQRPAEGFGERLGEVAGQIFAPFFGMIKGAQLINQARGAAVGLAGRQAKGTIENLAKNIADEAAKAPKRMALAETAAVPAIAGVRKMAEDGTIPSALAPTAEMVAGFMAPASIYAASKTPTAQAIKFTTKAIKSLKDEPSLTKKEGKIAAKVLRELAEDPELVLRRLEATSGDKNLTVAQRTEDALITSLEAKLISLTEGPKGVRIRSREGEKIVNRLKDAILDRGSKLGMNDTVGAAKSRLQSFDDAIKLRIVKASEDMNEAITNLKLKNPDKSGRDLQDMASLMVRESIEKALDDVVAQENKLWYRMPLSVKGSQENLVKALARILKTTGRAQLEDIPEAAKFINTKMYKKDGKLNTVKESVKELKGLYTKLGETSRKAIVAGDTNKARIAEILQEAILKDMDSWTGKGAAVNARIKEAREFSRLKNKYFKQGTVGEYLGYVKKGELKVSPQLTAKKILQGDSQERLRKTLDITEAEKFAKTVTGELDAELGTLAGIDDYLKATFLRDVIEDGIVNQAKAKSFMLANDRLLDLVPQTRVQLMRSREQADVLKKVTKAKDVYDRRTSDKSDSTLARLLNSDPDNIIRRVLSADRPDKLEQMKLILNIAKKDKSGEAVKGLKNAIARYMVDEATRPSNVSKITGRPVIDANRLLNRLIDDELLDKTLRLVYNQKEMSELRYAVKQMKKIQDSQAQIENVEAQTVLPGTLMEKVFKLVGVKAGAALGGGQVGSPLVLAGEGGKVMTKLFRRFNPDKARELLVRAFQDEELMKALLKRGIEDKKGNFKLNFSKPEIKMLRGYMVAPFVHDDEEEKFIINRELKNQEIINELIGQ